MKTIQFAFVTTVALTVLAAAQSVEKKTGDMSANQNTNNVSGASPNASTGSGFKDSKDEKSKDKTPAATNSAGKPAFGSGKKQAETKDTKEGRNAKDNSSTNSSDTNAASHQLAASSALLAAAVIAGAYI
ncbi:hypothetical protein H4S08_000176 [Coemansia sp. RSA 1365]|nr:hypothetical protein H4S08_000176 [Coemansia sp. RSA 1365]